MSYILFLINKIIKNDYLNPRQKANNLIPKQSKVDEHKNYEKFTIEMFYLSIILLSKKQDKNIN
jgi:hypothetical protein